MIDRWLTLFRYSIAGAVVAGYFYSIIDLKQHDYPGYRMFNTAAGVMAGKMNLCVAYTVAGVCALFTVYKLGQLLRGKARKAYFMIICVGILFFALAQVGMIGAIKAYNELAAQPAVLWESVEGDKWRILGALILFFAGVVLVARRRRTTAAVPSKPTFPLANVISRIRIPEYTPLTLAFLGVLVAANITSGVLRLSNAVTVGERPNVIFIMADTLRADHVGCYGYHRDTTPCIDRLAEDGLRFEHAMAQAPWTTWSVSSFMTSRYPQALGLGTSTGLSQLGNRFATMAEILKDKGYSTNAVISNPMWGSSMNCNQGFDFFSEEAGFHDVSSEKVINSALKRLEKIGDRRFFMFVLLADPHTPYVMHKEYNFDPKYTGRIPSTYSPKFRGTRPETYTPREVEYMSALYDSDVRYMDHHIGRFLEELKKRGLYDNSLVVFLSDHGEEFYDHEGFFHERTLYRELVDVPLIVKFPGRKQTGVVGGTFSLIDLLPSTLAFLKIDQTPFSTHGSDIGIDSIRSCREKPIYSATAFQEFRITSMVMGEFRSVYSNPYKHIVNQVTGEEQLYDLTNDLAEKHNILAQKPEVAATLRKALKVKEQDIGGQSVFGYGSYGTYGSYYGGDSEMTDKEKERLKSLGYL